MASSTDLNQEKNKQYKWKEILNLPLDEAKKCRFVCIDQSLRLFACETHKERHGLRLFPPHKFEVKEGVVYIKQPDNTLKVWYHNLYGKEKNNRGNSK